MTFAPAASFCEAKRRGLTVPLSTEEKGEKTSEPLLSEFEGIKVKKRVRVCYSGRVQGVGFRYTVLDVALKFNIFGWVKNLTDGRVELLAEAEEDVLKDFLNNIKSGILKGYIRDIKETYSEPTNEFKKFDIRFS